MHIHIYERGNMEADGLTLVVVVIIIIKVDHRRALRTNLAVIIYKLLCGNHRSERLKKKLTAAVVVRKTNQA